MYPRILSAINNKVKRPQKVPLFIFFIPKIFWHYSRLAPAVRRELHFRYGYLLSQGPKGPVKVDILVYAANFSCFIASAIIIVTVSATNDRLLHTIKHMPQVAAVVVITANAKGFFRCNRRTFVITKCQGLFGKGWLFCFNQCNLPPCRNCRFNYRSTLNQLKASRQNILDDIPHVTNMDRFRHTITYNHSIRTN